MVSGMLDISEAECPEEKYVQSELSPGTVKNQEKLGRFLYSKDHINEQGGIGPAAFQIDDLIKPERKGISVIRLDVIDPVELLKIESDFFARIKGIQNLNLCVATTKEIRDIRIGSRRAFCVVDDAEPNCKAHAIIRLEYMASYNRQTIRRIRHLLIEKFSIN